MTAPELPSARRHGRRVLALGGVLALALAGIFTLLTATSPKSASAANIPVSQCVSGDGAGLIANCTITIENWLTDDPATTHSTYTLNDGTGDVTTNSTDLVTSASQCNGIVNGGGSTVNCHVVIINHIAIDGALPTSAATVNQCVGSGDGLLGPTAETPCDPFPATTSGATIDQCNGSGNGGTFVPASECSASGTVSGSLLTTVDQCNGSAEGGGATVICSVSITTDVVDTGTTGPDSGGGTPGTGGGSGSITGIAPPSGGSAVTTDARLAG
jgi:hypothetical protein